MNTKCICGYGLPTLLREIVRSDLRLENKWASLQTFFFPERPLTDFVVDASLQVPDRDPALLLLHFRVVV